MIKTDGKWPDSPLTCAPAGRMIKKERSQKMKSKKLLSGVLILALLVCLFAVPAGAGSVFPDVRDDASYAWAVEMSREIGLFTGDAKGNFNPGAGITRAEFAAIVCRMMGNADSVQRPEVATFRDVPVSHWAAAYIGWAVENKIVNGYGNGSYGPNDPLLFEQAVKMLLCAAGYGDMAAAAGGWPSGYLKVADQLCILNGVSAAEGKVITRADVAVMACSLLRNAKSQT